MSLPPFNEKAKCPKCGHTEVRVYYCLADTSSCPWWLNVEGEHLHRQCGRCHYEWLEAVIEEAK